MKVVIDACVLYPTVMREMVLGAAALGHFTPLWSDRILEEWARAAEKLGPAGRAQAEAEIALTRSRWPDATLPPAPGAEARLWLPDPADIHVLAVAVQAGADAILTLNTRDFPKSVLNPENLRLLAPDPYLRDILATDPAGMTALAGSVLADANRLSGETWDIRRLMKKARLPRLGKALAALP